MRHSLQSKFNRQFMIGNALLAFAIILVVAIFVYISLRAQNRKSQAEFRETYSLTLAKGFVRDSLSIAVNDSVLFEGLLTEEPKQFQIQKFEQTSSVLFVNLRTDKLSVFELNERGGDYIFEKQGDEIVLKSETIH